MEPLLCARQRAQTEIGAGDGERARSGGECEAVWWGQGAALWRRNLHAESREVRGTDGGKKGTSGPWGLGGGRITKGYLRSKRRG